MVSNRSVVGAATALSFGLLMFSSPLLSQTVEGSFPKVHPRVRAQAETEEYVPVLISLPGQPHRAILDRMHERVARQSNRLVSSWNDDHVVAERQAAARELQTAVAPEQAQLVGRLQLAGARRIHPYYIQNLIAAEVPRTALAALDADPFIRTVRPVRKFVPSLYVSVPALGAPALWNMGQTGASSAMAVLDTGVDRSHPAFTGVTIVDHVDFAYALTDPCFADDATTGNDLYGHGSHVAGIVASRGAAGCPNCIGVDKGLGTLYNLKVGYKQKTSCGSSSASADMRDVLDAIQWALTNTPATIFNFSFGAEVTASDPSDTTDLDNILDLYGGFFAAAGGNGTTPGSACRVNTPADLYNGLGVASWDSRGAVSYFSCQGPSLDGRKKPDITAPGRNILSVCASATACDSTGFILKSGTSMASPHIAGAAALLWPLLPGADNRSRSLAARALLLNSTDNAGWAVSDGWGFANLTTAAGQLNAIADSVPVATAGGAFRLYRGPTAANAKATLTWNRHQVNGRFGVNNLDLFLYDRSGNQLSASQSLVDNTEQVTSVQAANAVVKVKMLSTPFASGISTEPFAVAFSGSGFIAARGPALGVSCATLAGLPAGASAALTCTVSNTGDLEAFTPTYQLAIAGLTGATPAGVSGSTLAPGASSKVSWTITVPSAPGTYAGSVSAASASFGETFQAAATVSLVVNAPVLSSSTANVRIGIFRNGLWLLDSNGSGYWEGATAGQDTLFVLGQSGDTPLAGDWNGNGTKKAGVFRAGLWVLDYNGNGQWDGLSTDRAFSFGQFGDQVLVGDWTGDGRDKLGVFRNGVFYLDAAGNGTFSKTVVLGQAGDTAVVGDWNGSGTKKVGIFRAGLWVLDFNGNGVWDGLGTGKDAAYTLGQAGDMPVVGDWNGSGSSKIGVFRAGLWVLDYNGNGGWDGPGTDRVYFGGQAGDTPVVGDWSGSGTAKAGYFRAGNWTLDTLGNGTFSRPGSLGQAGDAALTGRW